MTVDAALVGQRLRAVRASIAEAATAAGRDPASVRLVAASKGHPPEAIAAAAAAGQRLFGENYARELRDKRGALGEAWPDLEWHFIGRVQRGNAREIAHAALVHGVGSRGQAEALAARAEAPLPVLLQLSLWGEESKNGFDKAELSAELDGLLKIERLVIRGFMAMPPPAVPARAAFAQVRALRDKLAPDLPELSMGMSGDYAEAIREGATLVRVGTAIFGERPRARAEEAGA